MEYKFNENTRVQVPAAMHLCRLGYTYLDNITEYDSKTNILTDVFLRSVQHLNPELSELQAKQLLNEIILILDNNDLGREFYNRLSSNSNIKLIDFQDADRNEWHVTTEFTCENQDSGDSFRPDITCFVNGLPLAFIEVKKPNNHDGILAERERINVRMRNEKIQEILECHPTDDIFPTIRNMTMKTGLPIQGAFYCCTSRDKAFFNVFREADKDFITKYHYNAVSDSTEKQILQHRNCVVIKNLPDYNTNKDTNTPTNRILTSMLSKERFLFLLRYGFCLCGTERLNWKTAVRLHSWKSM